MCRQIRSRSSSSATKCELQESSWKVPAPSQRPPPLREHKHVGFINARCSVCLWSARALSLSLSQAPFLEFRVFQLS